MNKFRWCFIGAGSLAKTVAFQLNRSGRHEIVSCYTRNYEKGIEFAKKYGGKAYKTPEDAITAEGVDGVYIVTPSLNKSFKFQSDWPYSNSQVYLLGAIYNDINNDNEREFTKTESGYEFITKVNYPNNSELVKQKIILNNKLNFKMIKVYDKDDLIRMKMEFSKIDYSPRFSPWQRRLI